MKSTLLSVFALCVLEFVFFPNIALGESMTLNECVNIALKNNRSIEQAAAGRENARWGLSEARRSAGLSLTWSVSGMHIGGKSYQDGRAAHDLYGTASYDNEFSHVLSIQMPIYTGGQLEGAQKSARYTLNAADLQLENARQNVRYGVRAAYYQVLQCKSLIQMREEAVKNLKAHLKEVEYHYEVGIVAKSDILATSVQLANQQQALVTAKANYNKALVSLKNIMGISAMTELELTDNLKAVEVFPSIEECILYGFNNRPDALAAEYNVKSAEAKIISAKSDYKPKVNLVVEKSLQGEGALFKDDHKEAWKAGVEAKWKFFDNGVTDAKVNEANAAFLRVQSQAKEAKEKIELEIAEAYEDLTAAIENIRITEDAVNKASADYIIAQARYTEGVDTNLAVMDAQEKVIQARQNYYTALFNANTGIAKLEKAMGMPVEIDSRVYKEAVEDGKSSNEALNIANVKK